MHPERHLPPRAKELQKGEQGEHSLQNLLLCQGHPVPGPRATPGQVQRVQGVHEEGQEGVPQGTGLHSAEALREQANLHPGPHRQGAVGGACWLYMY